MNIFVLDNDMRKCAQAHCDKHIVKMPLESAQMLASAIHSLPISEEEKVKILPKNKQGKPYGAGYKNHPCSKWAGTSLQNFLWLRSFVFYLQDEYFYRYGKEHASYLTVKENVPTWLDPKLFPKQEPTLWPNCTTIKNVVCNTPQDIIQVYRDYYNTEKSHLLQYTRRKPPEWAIGAEFIEVESEEEDMGDRWNAQAIGKTELGAKDPRRTKGKRRLKKDVVADVIAAGQDANIDIETLIPKLGNLTIAQLEGIDTLLGSLQK